MSMSRFALRLTRLEALIQQEIAPLWDRLPDSELEALANRDPAAFARFRQAIFAAGSRLRSRHEQGCCSLECPSRRGEALEKERARHPAAVAEEARPRP
jgi:hypothetical protein